jgi:flagellar hook-associated protein 2
VSSILPTSSTSTTTSSGGVSSYSNPGGPPITFNGVISGLNTQAIIQALLAAYEQPQIDLGNQIKTLQSNLSDYQTIVSDLTALQTQADGLTQASQLSSMSASTSNSAVATATASQGAIPSSLSFTVNQLAQANVLASSQSVSSLSSVVASGNFLLSSQAAGFGVTSLAGSSLSVGTHTFNVTSALAGATATGSLQLPSQITIGSSNDTINATINGTATTITIASGTYTPAQLAAAISQASTSGGTPLLQAQVTPQGHLELGTTLLGSGASLQITGGTALATLGLATQSSASVGSAGSVTLDGTTTSVNNIQAGQSVTLADGSGGQISVGVGAFGIGAGTFAATEVAAGNGSLQQVVDNINAAGAGVTASAVQVASGAYVLQLVSDQTGTNAAITVEQGPFASALGSFQTISAAQNASVTIGAQGGYLVSSQTNQIQGVLPGVTLDLVSAQAPGSTPVTVTVSPNGTQLANQIQSLVQAANQVLSDINTYAGYNYQTNSGGPLMGDSTLNELTSSVLGAIAQALGQQGLSTQQVGITLEKNGQISFDPQTFAQAYDQNPSAVTSLFVRSGTFAPSSSAYAGDVSLVYAGNATVPGSYQVVVTQSATQATDAGNVLASGSITNAETITVQQGSQSAQYAASAGESLSAIAQGLNAAFATAGIGVQAQVVTNSSGSQLVLTATSYGSAGDFTVTSTAAGSGQTGLVSTANTPQTFTGLNVAGTINGVQAIGSGQILAAPVTDPTLAGLSLQVTAVGITSATTIGTFTYSPGLSGQLAYVANGAVAPVTGSLQARIAGIQQQISMLQQQYNAYTPMIQSEQKMLEQEFSNMESQLGSLKNVGSELTSQISQLP